MFNSCLNNSMYHINVVTTNYLFLLIPLHATVDKQRSAKNYCPYETWDVVHIMSNRFHKFLAWTLNTVRWLALWPGHLYVQDKGPHWTEKWTSPSSDRWVPSPWDECILKLRIEEQPPIWRIAAKVLNKQLHTSSKGWSSNLGVGWGAVYYTPRKLTMLQNHSQQSGILGSKRNKAVGVQKAT